MNIQWSVFNARLKSFDKIVSDKPLTELTDEEVQSVIDTATSASVFCNDASEVPVITEKLELTRQQLQWKGDVTSTPTSYENKKGVVVKGFRVGFNRELSRNWGIDEFNSRIAQMVR